MKRKIVKHGPASLTVSLPMKWAKKEEIKAGDEVEVEETPEGLLIQKEHFSKEKAIKLDFSHLEQRHMKWAIAICYKEGYDDIRIRYEQPEIIGMIESELVSFPGFEITEQSKNSCTIKNIAIELVDEYDSTVRRNFLNSISMFEMIIEKIKEKKFKEMKELVKMEEINNKLCMLCERMASGRKSRDSKHVFQYVIMWQLEKIVDEFKYICNFLSSEENLNLKISEDTIEQFEAVHKIFRMYYELYYSFDIEEQVKITRSNRTRRNRFYELISNKKGKENILLAHLDRASERIIECIPSTMAMNTHLYEVKE